MGLDIAVRVRGSIIRNRLYRLSREQLNLKTTRLSLRIRRPERGQIVRVIDESGYVKVLDPQGVEIMIAAVDAEFGIETE